MRVPARLAVMVLLAWAVPCPASEVVPYEAFVGVPVASVSIEGGGVSEGDLGKAIPLAAGEPFAPLRLAEGIRTIYRTGRYRQVTAAVNLVEGRLAVRIVLEPKVQARRFVFLGNLRVSEAELRRLIDLGMESDATTVKLDAATARMREYYAFRGFSDASVTWEILPPEWGRSDIVFAVREGSRALVADVRLEGDAGFTRLRLLSLVSTVPGEPFDGRTLDRDAARIVRHLKDQGYFFPEVSAAASEEAGGRLVTFTVRRNARFAFEVKAESASANGWIRRRIEESFRGAESREKAFEDAERRVREDYLSKGHSFVSLEWKTEARTQGAEDVTLVVAPGRRSIIGVVKVEGAGHFSPGGAEAILDLTVGEPFVRSSVDEAVARLEKRYRLEGYDAVLVKLLPLSFDPGPPDGPMSARIQIAITEGQRQTIGTIRVEGGPFAPEKAIQILGISVGGPYAAELLLAGRNELVTALTREGYAYASVAVEPSMAADGSHDVLVRIEEGPLLRAGRIVIAGAERTKERIVRLALDVETGQRLTTQEMLDAKERLYDLRVFSSADVRVTEPEQPGSPKDLLVDLEERPRYALGVRVGYGNEDRLRGEAFVTDRNAGGMARPITLRARGSDLERFVSLTYGHPWFLGRRMDFSGALSDLVEERTSYTRDALSATVNLTRKVSERTTANIGYSFEGLKLRNVSPGAQLSPDDVGKTDLATVQPELIYDSRNDILDPTSGMLGDMKLEVAWAGFGSEAEYAKVEVAHRRYLPLWGGLVGAAMIRGGIVKSYGKSDEVIISKRFFLGGFNSVRGYALDAVGPRDSAGDPVGGNYMINANLEMRYPLRGSLRGILFIDSGGLWLERQTYAGEALRFSAGAGLRWSSPIGPFSLDYGYKINPAGIDKEDRYRVHFSIGQAF